MPDLVFPDHALQRMRERDLLIEHVHQVVEDADRIIERDDGRTEYSRIVDDGRDVTVVVEDDGITVVSVMARRRRRPRRR